MSRTGVESRPRLLVTEYSDLYYVRGIDTGCSCRVDYLVERIVELVSENNWCVGVFYSPITRIREFRSRGWSILRSLSLWVKPVAYSVRDYPSDVDLLVRSRVLVDTGLFSEEFLERGEFGRVILGEVFFEFLEEVGGVKRVRGYIELLVHFNGVFVLTLSIPLHGYELSSRDLLRIRYLLESEGVLVELPRWVYRVWSRLKRGSVGEVVERSEGVVRIKGKVVDVLEAYSILVKYLAMRIRGREPQSLVELEESLRNPWDTDYYMVFTEVLRSTSSTSDLLRKYSIQLYSILHGTRKITSKHVLERIIRRAYHYVPIAALGEAGFPSPRRLVVSRVVALVTDTDTHVVVVTRKYLGPNEYGLTLRLKHLTVVELVVHLKQTLRVFEYLFTRRKLKSIDELISLREDYSRVADYVENTYFIVDRDMRQLFQRTRRALEIDRLNSNVERKLETLNYIIMTRYQDRLNKMQLVLSILFGIFGVPFFLFSYFQWYYDYVTLGKSPNFLPVTIATWAPTISILLITLVLYFYWQKKIYE